VSERISEIEPALTPEEWKEAFADPGDYDGTEPPYTLAEWNEGRRSAMVGWAGDMSDYHRAAALALYGQPFGFSEEHRAGVALAIEVLTNGTVKGADAYGVRVLQEVYNRIEALLPPRGTPA